MKRIKLAGLLCLAVITMISLSVVSANAQSMTPLTFATDYVTSVKYIVTHPDEAVKITKAYVNREQSNEVKEIIENSQGAQTYVRLINISTTVGRMGKTAIATVNPANSEQNRILSMKIDSPANYLISNYSSGNFSPQISLQSAPQFYKNPINFDPMILFKNKNQELVVLGILQNYSGRDIEVRGLPEIQLSESGKIIAIGSLSNLEEPMKMSYYRENQINAGVYDGLPDQCFIILIFEPGTYDDTVDISSLDSLECNYSLDYSYLD